MNMVGGAENKQGLGMASGFTRPGYVLNIIGINLHFSPEHRYCFTQTQVFVSVAPTPAAKVAFPCSAT